MSGMSLCDSICVVILWLSIAALVYVYLGYYIALRMTTLFYRRKRIIVDSHVPNTTVVIVAYNEQDEIASRIDDVLEQDYPKEHLEIIVASDGSTDKTVEIASAYRDKGVVVLDFKENRGRAFTHNKAVAIASGEILVFTDAETRFEKEFLKKLLRNYADPAVGSVSGHLCLLGKGGVVTSESIYFRYELVIRSLEDKLGILVTGTGACFSVRKELYNPLGLIDDVDFSTPIDCIKAGKVVVYEPEAKVYDRPPTNFGDQYRARVRMTSKNFLGTIRRCGRGFSLRFTAVWLGLISHKFMRWFTGYFMAAAFLSNIQLTNVGLAYIALFSAQAGCYIICLVNYIGGKVGFNIPVVSHVSSFVVATYGMSVGIFNSMTGRIPVKWGKVTNV